MECLQFCTLLYINLNKKPLFDIFVIGRIDFYFVKFNLSQASNQWWNQMNRKIQQEVTVLCSFIKHVLF